MNKPKKSTLVRMNIRNLDKIRDIYRKIYIYGMYTREDFIKSGSVSSPESYDKIIKQFRDLYFYNVDDCEKAIEADTENSGKHKRYKFRRNYFESPGEQLVAVYGLYAVSDASVDEIIRCLCAAHSSQAGITVSGLSLTCPVKDESAPSPESRIRRRLDKLCEYGYLTKHGKYYQMKDALAELSDNELISLFYYASFCSGIGYPRVAAFFLRESIRRHIMMRGLNEPPEAFLFRDSTCAGILDEQVVMTLLDCCLRDSVISAKIKGVSHTLKPLKLRIDTKYGRWYLIALSESTPMIIRVSNITDINELEEKFDRVKAEKIADEKLKFCLLSNPATNRPVTIRAELRFPNRYTREQFEREMLIGEITKGESNEFYTAKVTDTSELKPFLRSYAGYLRILPSEEHTLREEILSEYEEMLKNYESVQ